MPISIFSLASPLFCDNMVLQRDAKVPIWGTADPGEKILATVNDLVVFIGAGRLVEVQDVGVACDDGGRHKDCRSGHVKNFVAQFLECPFRCR